MQQRSPAAVFFLSLITFGIYSIYWQVKTKGELKAQGADIPTAWLIIVPIANLYWIWKYSLGVEQVSKGKITAVLTLILLLLLSIVGMAILQSEYNKLGTASVSGGPAPAPPTEPEAPAPEPPSAPPAV
jgi:hypothetical protein